jgi:hypothetical protein
VIRFLFAMFAGAALLVAGAGWLARDRSARELAAAVAPIVERTIELAERVPRRGAPSSQPSAATVAPPPPESPVARAAPPPPEPSARPPTAPSREVEEVLLPDRSGPFVEAPLPAAPSRVAGHAVPPTAEERLATRERAEAAAPPRPDQDAWGALIRRMLGVYRRIGASG